MKWTRPVSALALIPLWAISDFQTQSPIMLLRRSSAGESLSYSVKTHLQVESRGAGFDTWLPQSFDLDYDFQTKTLASNQGGMMTLIYTRPSMTEHFGETFEGPPRSVTRTVGLRFRITLSPINEIVEETDLAPNTKASSGKEGEAQDTSIRLPYFPLDESGPAQQAGELSRRYVDEVYRLALNLGSLDSSLDFQPKLPLDEVAPGDTWKKTVGFTPGAGGGSTKWEQRLDYTYAYRGFGDWQRKRVLKIGADLSVNTDLGPYLTSLDEDTEGIASIPLHLKEHIDFDLDASTGETLDARTTSSGGYAVFMKSDPRRAAIEQRFKGHGEMTLTNRSPGAVHQSP